MLFGRTQNPKIGSGSPRILRHWTLWVRPKLLKHMTACRGAARIGVGPECLKSSGPGPGQEQKLAFPRLGQFSDLRCPILCPIFVSNFFPRSPIFHLLSELYRFVQLRPTKKLATKIGHRIWPAQSQGQFGPGVLIFGRGRGRPISPRWRFDLQASFL